MKPIKATKSDVDGSRLESMTGEELLQLLQLRASKCTHPNPPMLTAFARAAGVVEVLNAWIRCSKSNPQQRQGMFLPDLFEENPDDIVRITYPGENEVVREILYRSGRKEYARLVDGAWIPFDSLS